MARLIQVCIPCDEEFEMNRLLQKVKKIVRFRKKNQDETKQ